MSVFLLSLIAVAQGWVACPLLACNADFSDNECAKRSNSPLILLNQNGCDDDFSCSFFSLITWADSNSSQNLNCSPSQDLHFNGSWPCPTRIPLRNLAEGAHPKQCVLDSDCLLQDNSTSPCVCTPSSTQRTGFCKPDKNELIFGDYWDECERAGKVQNRDWALYFYLLQQYMVLYMAKDAPDCVVTVLYEFQQMEKVKNEIMEAVGAGLALMFAAIFGLI